MRAVVSKKSLKPVNRRLAAATAPVFEKVESRMMMTATVANWSFAGTVTSPPSVTSPAAGSTGVTVTNGQNVGTPVLKAIGMTSAPATVDNEDIVPTAGTANAGFSESLWRLRGASTATAVSVTNGVLSSNVATLTVGAHSFSVGDSVTVGGSKTPYNGTFTLTAVTPTTISYTDVAANQASKAISPSGTVVFATANTNGWSTSAPQYTQGAEIDLNTTGYASLNALTFDWYATTSGVKDLMVQYNLNTASSAGWTNLLMSPLVATSNDYYGAAASGPTNTIDLSGVAGAGNDASFGIRLVSAYDPNFTPGAYSAASSPTAGTQTPIANTGGNWRFGNVGVAGTLAVPVAPSITAQPSSTTVSSGSNATFTAAASGYPTPSVQWQLSTNSGTSFADIAGATSTTYTVTAAPAGNNGYQYRAVFTNASGSATTSPAILTVQSSPIVTLQPVAVTASSGQAVTFTAKATSTNPPTVQWQSSPDGTTWTNIPGATAASTTAGVTTATYNFTPTESQTGYQFRAVFTSGAAAPASTNGAKLTVIGNPFAQWIFSAGKAPIPNSTGSYVQGSADEPLPSLRGSAGDNATTLGLQNDYTGNFAFSEADILPTRSSINANFNPYVWRVRSGSGLGPTGSPGTPEGWSQLAPQYSQGVQFMVSTAGYANVTLHFDWNGGGIADMQAQYTPDGGATWINTGSVIQNYTKDYLGITTAALNSTYPLNPAGVTVNLQGITAANNNPNFGIRLVSAYDPALPQITDGNALDPVVHGQYASATLSAVSAQQVLNIGAEDSTYNNVSGGTFTLTFGGQTTGPLAYNISPADLQAALTGLSSIGTGNVVVSTTAVTPFSVVNPTLYTIQFQGTLGNKPEPTITVDASGLTGSNPTATLQTWVPGASTGGVSRYQDGGGAWSLGNFSFNGDKASSSTTLSLVPGIVVNPSATTTVATLPSTYSFSATEYSDQSSNSVQWQINTGSGWTNIAGAAATTLTATTSPYIFTSTYAVTETPTLGENGNQFRAVFTNAAGNSTTQPAVLTVVSPSAPTITLQPVNVSVQQDTTAVLTAQATGSPSPTVQWQFNSGFGWQNLVDSLTAPVVSGSTSTTLRFTAPLAYSGRQYRAVFTNAVTSVNTNVVLLNVLQGEAVFTDWDFSAHPATGAGAFDNSPAPTIGTGTAVAVGMTRSFDRNDPATGTDGFGSVPACDVVNTPGALNPVFNENTWRIRGGPTATTGGTPANGWSNFAPENSQGVEFDSSTVGYHHVYVTMDFYTTTSGILDAQQEYTLDGTNWVKLGGKFQALSNDFYGATASGGPIPLVFDVTGIAGVDNNTSFGVRVVSAYNDILTAQNNGLGGVYSNAALVGNPAGPSAYNGSKGNWRFANIIFHGDPLWLDPASIATWTPATRSLVVGGASKIIGDPGVDAPNITFNGSGSVLTIDPGTVRTVNIGSISITGGNSVVMPSTATTHILIDQGALALSAGNTLDIGRNFLDLPSVTLGNLDPQLQAGYLYSSATTAGVLGAIGAITNGGSFGSAHPFNGTVPAPTDTLVRYTYLGDANLDGVVDGSDYTKIDAAFGTTVGGWANGDFNQDHLIDGSDYTLIDNAFNTQSLPLLPASQIASATGLIAASSSFRQAASGLSPYFAQSTPIVASFLSKDDVLTGILQRSDAISMVDQLVG